MKAAEEVLSHLKPGSVYRRADLLVWSNAIDRHLKELERQKKIHKLAGGLYYYPKRTTFGEAPPQERELVEVFLKDNRFLMLTPSAYNTLGVGTTQLYNETVVYNHKRHGIFYLGNKEYRFVRKPYFPKKLSHIFLMIDLVGNLNKLAEDQESILKNLSRKACSMNLNELSECAEEYGSLKAKKFYKELLKERKIRVH